MTIDFADVKPSVFNWMVVGLLAVTFISFWKFVFSYFNIHVLGVDTLFASI